MKHIDGREMFGFFLKLIVQVNVSQLLVEIGDFEALFVLIKLEMFVDTTSTTRAATTASTTASAFVAAASG